MIPDSDVDLSQYPLHCPKCGMAFHRVPWPYMGGGSNTHHYNGASAMKSGVCAECGVEMVSGQSVSTSPVKVMVQSVDQARRCWGLA